MPYPILPTKMGGSAFKYPDPEGAPDVDGVRYHGAVDWFATGGTPVASAVTGYVVEVRRTTDRDGQVYGGVLKVREASSGRVYVFRHIDPKAGLQVGSFVRAGQQVGNVTPWNGGPSHIHLEVWKTLAGGYRIPNMIDPALLRWEKVADVQSRDPLAGAYLRITIDGGRIDVTGAKAVGALLWIAERGLKTDRCAIAWRGPNKTATNVWRGRRDVTAVCRVIRDKYL